MTAKINERIQMLETKLAQLKVRSWLDKALTRADDRALFGLDRGGVPW